MANNVALFLERLAGDQRVMMMLVGIGALAVIFSISRWSMAPSWVPVASGLAVERMGEAIQRLDDAGIDHRLERGGAMVTVPDREAARARVVLAAEGLTGSSGSPGFELFDQQSWGMTDFTQRVNYRRALEGELERTIGQMSGVRSARVHLALRQGSFLRGSDEAGEASIMLTLTGGGTPTESVVEGVQALVAGSVEGLAAESVSILDDHGRLLSTPDAENGAGATSIQLKMRRQIEEYMEIRAEALVAQIVGPGNASVRVAAELNFDQIERTVQGVDPDQQLLVSEERAEITPGTREQGAASVTSSTVFETTRSLETMSRNGARLERLTVAVLIADTPTEAADGTVSFQSRSAEELTQIEALVANSVGLSRARGDLIFVMSAPFAVEPELPSFVEDEALDLVGLALAAQRPVMGIIGLGMAFLLSLRLLSTLSKSGGRRVPLGPAPGTDLVPAAAPTPVIEAAPVAEVEPVSPPALQVADPEMAAKVLRSWMQEA